MASSLEISRVVIVDIGSEKEEREDWGRRLENRTADVHVFLKGTASVSASCFNTFTTCFIQEKVSQIRLYACKVVFALRNGSDTSLYLQPDHIGYDSPRSGNLFITRAFFAGLIASYGFIARFTKYQYLSKLLGEMSFC